MRLEKRDIKDCDKRHYLDQYLIDHKR